MYINRTCETMLKKIGQSFPCIVVYGPRQVGKSTTINYLFGKQYRSITLDDQDDRNLAIQSPKLFLETYGWPLIIDEIQKAPCLLDEIKKIIDKERQSCLDTGKKRELMYILTGSNRFELQQGISDSLAGRCGIFDMLSLSQAEKHGTDGKLFDPAIESLLQREKELYGSYRTRQKIFDDIFQGGMPDVVTGVSERDIYYKSYIDTYLEKDIKKLISVGNELQFRNFLSIVALRTSQELHYDTIANSIGIDVRTCKRWLSILEMSGIIYLLEPYMANISNRIIKTPKLYFTDTGLCAYLCRWPDSRMLQDCAMSGAFFETYVVSELIKNFYAHNRSPKDNLFYYRDIDQKEIDLIYVDNNGLTPIEIKTNSSPQKPTRHFNVLNKYNMTIQKGLVIDTCENIRPINENAYAYPVSILGM